MPKRAHLVFIFIIIAVTLVVYYDSFSNSFVYDDYPFLVDNPAVKNLTPGGVASNFCKWQNVSSCDKLAKDVWRPLMTTSFALDYKIWKLDARFYHIENTALHIINALLVYIVVMLIAENGLAALIAALVFAVHPVQTEAVTWISGRSNVLFLFFFLIAFIAHVLDRQGKAPRSGYSLALIFFALSLFSKEMAVVFPLICVLYDAYFFNKGRLRRYVEYYLPFFGIAVLYVVARFSVLGVVAQKSQWWGGSILSNLFVTLEAVGGYVRLLFLPVNLRVEYAVHIPSSFLDPRVIAALVILSLVFAVFAIFRRNKPVAFYILWFFVSLAPVYNIVPFKAVIGERFLYLPLIGFASLFGIVFAAVSGSARIKSGVKILTGIMLGAVIVMYAALSISRNLEWKDEVSFYMNEAVRSPSVPKAHYNLAYACVRQAEKEQSLGRREEAARYYVSALGEFQKTVSLKPDSQIGYVGIANTYNALALYDQAITFFHKALAIQEHADIYNNLGVAYYKKEMFSDAEASFKKALALDPDHVNATINLGNIYFINGKFGAAKKMFLRAIRLGGPAASVAAKMKELERKGY